MKPHIVSFEHKLYFVDRAISFIGLILTIQR